MKLYVPNGCTSISFGGITYDVSPDGSVDIPVTDTTHLIAHGFTTSPQMIETQDAEAQDIEAQAKDENDIPAESVVQTTQRKTLTVNKKGN